MKDARTAAVGEPLALDEQITSIDSGVSEVGTLKPHDIIALRAELDWLDELKHPWGPFPTYQRHLEYILSQYDSAPVQGYAHAARIESRRD